MITGTIPRSRHTIIEEEEHPYAVVRNAGTHFEVRTDRNDLATFPFEVPENRFQAYIKAINWCRQRQMVYETI